MEEENIREIRINLIIPAESVLVATVRSKRPKKEQAYEKKDTSRYVDLCPFCRGNERLTPP